MVMSTLTGAEKFAQNQNSDELGQKFQGVSLGLTLLRLFF
jgi:hypothetical protein